MSPIPKEKVSEISTRAEKALNRLRPALHADGGDARIVDLSPDGVLTIELLGACGGCAMSMMTLKNGIERVIKKEVPEIVLVQTAARS